jgi:IMP dehydrogenase/GMP reductase
MENIMLSLDEIGLLPSEKPTQINSRSQVIPYISDSKNETEGLKNRYPVFVAPMTSVVNKDNLHLFEEQGFTPIVPRNYSFEERLEMCQTRWVAFSLQEFTQIYDEEIPLTKKKMYVLVDIANGHIDTLYIYAKRLKEKYSNVIIMVGNIAHPRMYVECCEAKIDYVRVGIGGGSVCTTSVQTGIHASLVWMIEEINEIKRSMPVSTCFPQVIADGGINTIDRMIKCLALGYDYVMAGKLFAKTKEACGEQRVKITTNSNDVIYLYEIDSTLDGDIKNIKYERVYYGMASELGQNAISGGVCKNPEGIVSWVPIEYSLKEFKMKFEASLRSTMSYIGAYDLHELKLKTIYLPMSQTEFNAYYK